MPRHLALGLGEIPVGQAADLGAVHRVLGKQPPLALQHAARLVEIFGDHRGADDRHVAFGKQHGQGRRRVERQKLLAPRPRLFLDQHEFLAILAEGETDEAASGEHRVVEKRQHGPAKIFRALAIGPPCRYVLAARGASRRRPIGAVPRRDKQPAGNPRRLPQASLPPFQLNPRGDQWQVRRSPTRWCSEFWRD